jgi:nuclear pore complex protein Nup133
MFSVEGGSARSSLRSTRRRPRASDGPQQGRRKRSKLGDDTFVAVADAHTHGNGNGSLVMNGHAPGTAESSLVTVDVPVREKNSAPVRASKDDSALYLVCILVWTEKSRILTTVCVEQER